MILAQHKALNQMINKNPYQAFLRAKILGAIEEARAASALTHQGVKGSVLEILVSRLFRPLLPADIGVGTGQIVDHTGELSNQVDIILYDKSILPPALYDENTGIFPVEAVLYAIEIKTTLDADGLKKAHEAAKKLHGFSYLDGAEGQEKIEKARSVVFALNSNLRDGGEADRYKRLYTADTNTAFISAICVVGQEYVYDDHPHWVIFKPPSPFDEVLCLIGGVMNTYKWVASTRRGTGIGHYIIPSHLARLGPKKYGPPTGKA